MKVVFLDRDTIGPSVTIIRPSFAHEWVEYGKTAPEDVAARIADADIVVTNKAPVREQAIAAASKLKMIAVAATGYDVIDLAFAKERGIIVSNVRGYAVNTVPEHTFALIFALRRSIVGFRQDVIAGEWQRANQFCFFNHPIRDLAGSTLGVFGRGTLGKSVARIGEAFGMKVIFAARKDAEKVEPGYTAFDDVLETVDIITFHMPLTPTTRNLIGIEEFRRMKKRPLIINTARGGLVNEADLVTALDEGLIAGAGFDVLTKEPPAPDNPLLAVLERPNVIVTPHVAWASDEAMQTLWAQVISHIENFKKGTPTNVL
ncbi:D-2-hydroxyacid dehydrogenase [Neorhizobium petrolearium]|uniref:D-2-hydroxyacid dehydrogenase n=1 Tax=Neorhizobium petrolearium TaxID=515361 RepID=A0ABY8M4Q1_9HYPH|nr:D-2-hydroxyacid dehydrogenase [Neorhizobium petrolearium]MCC2608335.1 D-2-hydroxyacid dehydrogenase [Neorhizobium petrolearium]WGI68614.1 D-2-hydroxyacid dehydrogenase [Neorhizobium petrolearium]